MVEWLTSLGVPFSDTRPVGESSDEKSGLDSGFVRPTIAFHAGENAARGEGPARVEIALAGDAGVELTVRFPPGVPWSEARGLAEGFTAETLNLGAPTAPAAGGVAATNAGQTPRDPLVAAVRYPGAGLCASAPRAACAGRAQDARRARVARAVTHRAPDTKSRRSRELVSCVVACVGNKKAVQAARVVNRPAGSRRRTRRGGSSPARTRRRRTPSARRRAPGTSARFVAALEGKDGDHWAAPSGPLGERGRAELGRRGSRKRRLVYVRISVKPRARRTARAPIFV